VRKEVPTMAEGEFSKEQVKSKIVKKKQQKENTSDCDIELTMGQFELLVLSGRLRQRLEEVEKTVSKSPAESQVLLGREEEIKWVLDEIVKVLERDN
jgi:hypothetical protein